uniref:Fatty acid synthase n=1 Tax=Trichuris muris TaxID=70415 RepID=A0A5S6QNC3_TRIMR
MPIKTVKEGKLTNGTCPPEPWERLTSSGESTDFSNTSTNSINMNDVSDGQWTQCSANDVTESQVSFESEETMPWWKGQEDIVISGISGRLPESDNMQQFAEHLMNGDDLITEDNRRWEPGLFGLPRRHGKIKELAKFDAAFFGVHPKQAKNMDPQLRMLLEVAFEALLDAGVNPVKVRGSRTGVFVGCSGSETAACLTRDPELVTGYSLTGCVRSMFANRLSYFLDLRGPSFAVDTACSSSLLALQLAVDAIRKDECEAALVAGSHLTLTPTTALQFMRLGLLSQKGMCQTFDANGEGYVRSEGIVAILLQKATVARRSYATVVHAMSNTDGYKEQGVTFPSGQQQAQLLKRVYKEAGVDPNTVVYVETHGTGTKVGDPEEANALCEVYCTKRSGPLLVGSVKSNMGHAEPASGLAAIAKMLIAMQTGYLPPNLHFEQPNPYIPGLADGRLKVVTEKTPWKGGTVGVNSFGFGGSNTHVVLRSAHRSDQSTDQPYALSHRLFLTSGRTEPAAQRILDEAEKRSTDEAFLSLLSAVAGVPASMYPFRAYAILNRADEPPLRSIQKYTSVTDRPVWFVYSGMGSQWIGMGKDLIEMFPVFARTIVRCSEVLKPFGLSPMAMIMNEDKKTFVNNPLNCFVCICTIQIALTRMLKMMGVEPDGIVGHSTGEMVAGYCDGCFTLEETILTAYFRGKAMVDAKFPLGGMAAVGLTADEVAARCGKGVYVACHNAEDSTSISGLYEEVKRTVSELQKDGIFAKMIDSSGMAFHSPLIQSIGDSLRKTLSHVIPQPKLRSSRWISSSVPESKWDSNLGRYCSAEYHVNNTLSPVLFYEALLHVPENAIIIEVAPHCLLQSIIRRVVPRSCTYQGLMNSREASNVDYFLQALGRLYQAGLSLDVHNVYGTVNLPVPLETPMISPLIEWDHSSDWPVVSMKDMLAGGTGGLAASCSINVDPFNPEMKDQFYLDHIIDGRVLFPFTGHLINAWRAVCKIRGLEMEKTPVIIEDVHVYRATILSHPITFNISVGWATGNFEILEGDSLAASGRITVIQDEERPLFYENAQCNYLGEDCERIELTTADVYKELLLRGYEYGKSFRCIYQACNAGDRTSILWNGNWVTFLDALLQTALLMEKMDTLKLPTRMRYLRIDPEKHRKSVIRLDDKEIVDGRCDAATNGFAAGGVEVRELVAQTVPRRLHHGTKPTLEQVKFFYFENDHCLSESPSRKAQIDSYTTLCEALLDKCVERRGNMLAARLGLPMLTASNSGIPLDEQSLRQCLADPKCAIAQLLNKIIEEPQHLANEQTLGELNKWFIEHANLDILWNCTTVEEIVKPLLDIALENNSGHSDRILMFEPSTTTFAELCVTLQQSHPLVKVTWTLAGPSVEQFKNADQRFDLYTVNLDGELENVPSDRGNYDLALLDRVLSKKRNIIAYLDKVKKFLRPDGFAIVNEFTSHFALASLLTAIGCPGAGDQDDQSRYDGMFLKHDVWLKLFDTTGFDVIGYQRDDIMQTMYFIRKRQEVARVPHVINVDDVTTFEWLKPLQATLEKYAFTPSEDTVCIVSNRPTNGVPGLALCLREEHAINKIRSVMNASHMESSNSSLDLDGEEVRRVMQLDLHSSLYRNGRWGCYRHFRLRSDQAFCCEETEHAFINTLTRGDLNSLTWVSSPNVYCTNDSPTKEICSVYYASINFRDIMLATGRLSIDSIPGMFIDKDCLLGMEYAGRLPSGKRVMGLLPCQAMATSVVVDLDFMWKVPDNWSMQEAATVPVVFTTAFYALVVRGRIRAGDKILIHSGSGGVGMAAISIALSYGCEVFTTVGSDEKKAFLKTVFPELKDHHFSNSRTTEFEFHIMHQTRGQGVDLVLNSLAEEKLHASVRCLAQHGRFLEIGKYDLAADSKLGMSIFLKNATFHGILLDSLFEPNNHEWQMVKSLLAKGIAEGLVRPLPMTIFPHSRVEEAFRFMATGKHKGKVLLKIREEEEAKVCPPSPLKVKAATRSYCCPSHVYLITGGLGGLGLELANWLVTRGARKLVLTSRSGVRTGYQARCLYFWRRMGVIVSVSALDVGDEQQTERLFKEAREIGPIGGIFHLAMILRDCLFENQTVENFVETSAAKYAGTKNLDTCARKYCGPELKWFVAFSSQSCARGNSGQTNYGWANSCMERFVEHRIMDNLPGIVIQWGAIGDVGIIVEKLGDNSTVVGGTNAQRIPSCLQCLDSFLSWKQGIFSSFIRAETDRAGAEGRNGNVMQTIAHILGISDLKQVDQDSKLGNLGLDSLMGVEIKQTLERDYDIALSMKEIRGLTLNKLAEIVSNPKDKETIRDLAKSVEEDLKTIMEMFRLYFQADDLRPELPVVKLNTIEEGTPVFLVHPIEGVKSPLEMLGSKLPFPAYCFQCTPAVPLNTMESIALHYISCMEDIQPTPPYRIIGYSYGANIAFEMATLLQQKYEGDKCAVQSLILLDGSHRYMRIYRNAYRLAYGVAAQNLARDTNFECEILLAFSQRFAEIDYRALREQLVNLPSWEERVNLTKERLMEAGSFKDSESIEFGVNSLRQKFLVADRYKPTRKFQGDATLVKSSKAATRPEDVGNDYGLKEVISGNVFVHVVNGDHYSFIHEDGVEQTVSIVTDVLNTSAIFFFNIEHSLQVAQ